MRACEERLVGPGQQRQIGVKKRERREHVPEADGALDRRDPALPLRSCQRVGDFHGENIGCDQVMHLMAEVIPDAEPCRNRFP